MAAPSKRIPLNPIQNGLNQAFASLEMSGLPQGPGEGKETPESQSPPHEQLVPGKPGRVVLRREKAHRGGKTVLVVDGFGSQHTDLAIEALGKRLRSGCGCGGTVRGRAIELQGDQPGRIRTFLEGEGFQVAGEK
jgi:translation initiation factor 1